MEYVKYKLERNWWNNSIDFPIENCVTKGGLYFFPYFISDDFDRNWNLCKDKNVWEKEFEFICKKEFIELTGIDKETIDFLESLLENRNYSSFISDVTDSNFIIVKTILEKYKYGKKAINSKIKIK